MERSHLLRSERFEIPCTIYEPGYGTIDQVIIGVHGFGGSKDSSVLAAVAEEMFFYRTAMITFDFPGHGESTMSARELTVCNCQDCLLAVADYAREIFQEATNFGVFASSFGAYIALLAMDDLNERFGRVKVVLRAPAVRMHTTFLTIARQNERDFMKKGRVICGYDRKMEIPYSFYEDLAKHNAMADYDMPMMILQGELDDVVLRPDVEFFRLLNGKSCLVTLPGAGHRFDHDGDLDRIVDLTRDWFLCEEVLLCEFE